jgi:hypothetical protein
VVLGCVRPRVLCGVLGGVRPRGMCDSGNSRARDERRNWKFLRMKGLFYDKNYGINYGIHSVEERYWMSSATGVSPTR